MHTIINGYLILFFAFTSALFSSRFKYYYYDFVVNLIRCSADVKAKNSIRNLMMMTREVIGHSDWAEERILCCEKMVRYFADDDDTDKDDYDNHNYTLLIISY